MNYVVRIKRIAIQFRSASLLGCSCMLIHIIPHPDGRFTRLPKSLSPGTWAFSPIAVATGPPGLLGWRVDRYRPPRQMCRPPPRDLQERPRRNASGGNGRCSPTNRRKTSQVTWRSLQIRRRSSRKKLKVDGLENIDLAMSFPPLCSGDALKPRCTSRTLPHSAPDS